MMNKQNPKLQALITKLREIFQIDRPELDFGIYRILNVRATEIADYLENRLPEKVQVALAEGTTASAEHLRDELQKAEESANALGVSPDGVPKVQELRSRLKEAAVGASEYENAVFSHLLTFFSRYYDDGDFISQRRYKGDTYAIPYAGEEVMLYWANKDQYYTKSGENFSNYSFKLADGRTVHFRLVAADTAKDNRKDNDKDRRFAIIQKSTVTRFDDDGEEYEEELLPVEEVKGPTGPELIIRFEYKPVAKGVQQDAMLQKTVETVLADSAVKTRWLDLGNRAPTEKNPQRTLLAKQLADYTTKNTADYFIHKDLGGFLKRELDFYIKNEVLHLDDVQNAGVFGDIEKNLRMIQCLRSIALELIGFLAQIENFQKKLWLKKKFVVSSHYCITLDRVPEEVYPEIAANEKQWEQWFDLGLRESATVGKVEDLKAAPYLMVDTSLFEGEFAARVPQGLSDFDGILINSDNFQGLNLLLNAHDQHPSCIYIDPPYNTDASPIIYKNGYQHSSWASLFSDRMRLALPMLATGGMICVAIDDFEYPDHFLIMNDVLSLHHSGTAVVRSKPQGRPTASGFSANHEYAVFWSSEEKPNVGRLPRVGSKAERYPLKDEKGIYSWANFRKSGTDSDRTDRRKSYYPVFVSGESARVPRMSWDDTHKDWFIEEDLKADETDIWPKDAAGIDKVWTCSAERLKREIEDLRVIRALDGTIELQKKYRPNQDGALPGTWWDRPEYSASESGTAVLKNLFGHKLFDFPKSINLVVDNLRVLDLKDGGIVLDYFAGSGTTGAATMALNREDGGHRRYILVEQGDYFDTVLKPRLQKVVYSADWKDGKPTAPSTGISHCLKVLKLESYEDTLNNLELRRTSAQGNLLAGLPQEAREDYLLHYMLDVESRGSILSVSDFRKPFDYEMNIAVDSAGAYERRKVDLVETFNYLIGLRVKHIDANLTEGYVRVEGTLPSGESALVLWRDCDKIGYEILAKYANRFDLEGANNPFSVIYINGDHNLPTSYTPAEGEDGSAWTRRIHQIEPVFLERMFAGEEV